MSNLKDQIALAMERVEYPERFDVSGARVPSHMPRLRHYWKVQPPHASDETRLSALLMLACTLAEAQRDVIARATEVASRMKAARDEERAPSTPLIHLLPTRGEMAPCGASVHSDDGADADLNRVTCTACIHEHETAIEAEAHEQAVIDAANNFDDGGVQ